MNKTEMKKESIAECLSDYLLSEGMQAASLRRMAKAAGTSDRMLLHYFADKEELMNEVLTRIANRLLNYLKENQPGELPFQELVAHLSGMAQNPAVRPYLRLWLELMASASAGDESCRRISTEIFRGFYDWVSSIVLVDREEDRRAMTALAVVIVEGCIHVDTCGFGTLVSEAQDGLRIYAN